MSAARAHLRRAFYACPDEARVPRSWTPPRPSRPSRRRRARPLCQYRARCERARRTWPPSCAARGAARPGGAGRRGLRHAGHAAGERPARAACASAARPHRAPGRRHRGARRAGRAVPPGGRSRAREAGGAALARAGGRQDRSRRPPPRHRSAGRRRAGPGRRAMARGRGASPRSLDGRSTAVASTSASHAATTGVGLSGRPMASEASASRRSKRIAPQTSGPTRYWRERRLTTSAGCSAAMRRARRSGRRRATAGQQLYRGGHVALELGSSRRMPPFIARPGRDQVNCRRCRAGAAPPRWPVGRRPGCTAPRCCTAELGRQPVELARRCTDGRGARRAGSRRRR